MPEVVRVRFAPSPTGHLHVGNARTALFNWLFARGRGGAFVLRIEDTDVERSSRESEEAIFEDLHWLGLDWDEGPGRGGGHGPYRQSERRDRHQAAASQLLDSGAAYRCFCTVQQIEEEREAQRRAGLPPRYGGRCRALPADEARRRAASEPHALRFRVLVSSVVFRDLIRGEVEFPGAQIGDPVIVRVDGAPTYNFAVVVDDVQMEITHVIRGEDHLSNTPRQVLIYRALERTPPLFAHVPMVLGPDGSPLSKRHGASSVAEFRGQGILPEAMANYLVLLGWAHPEGREVLTLSEIASVFGLERVGRAASMFDVKKLWWVNAHHLRAATPERLLAECRQALSAAGYVPATAGPAVLESWIGRALQTYAGQMTTLADAVSSTAALFRFRERVDQAPEARAALTSLAGEPLAADIITLFAEAIERRRPALLTDRDLFRSTANDVGRSLQVSGRALYHPIRVAMTASETGPELDRLVPLIDEGSTLDLAPPVLSCVARARLVAGRIAKATA